MNESFVSFYPNLIKDKHCLITFGVCCAGKCIYFARKFCHFLNEHENYEWNLYKTICVHNQNQKIKSFFKINLHHCLLYSCSKWMNNASVMWYSILYTKYIDIWRFFLFFYFFWRIKVRSGWIKSNILPNYFLSLTSDNQCLIIWFLSFINVVLL